MRNENITCIYIQCVYFFYIKTNKQTDIQKKNSKTTTTTTKTCTPTATEKHNSVVRKAPLNFKLESTVVITGF